MRALLLVAAMLTACGDAPPPGPLTQQVYVWQRAWTEDLRTTIAAETQSVAGWRVLVAERVQSSSDSWLRMQPDWATLAGSGQPVTAVIRVDNTLVRLREPAGNAAQLRVLEGLLTSWRQARQASAAAGVKLAGLELDYDCGSARLADYAAFLRALRLRLAEEKAELSITALPAWLEQPRALKEVLQAIDSHVLQVHGVSRPQQGLWNARQSERWLREWAALSPHRFALALPNYGSAVRLSGRGEIMEVSSNGPEQARAWPADTVQLELVADPLELARFVAGLQKKRPANLQALYWFRQPVPGEKRGYSLASWRLLRNDPAGFVRVSEQAAPVLRAKSVEGIEGALRWSLGNSAAIDLRLPASLHLPQGCEAAQPLGSASVLSDGSLRIQEPLLRAGAMLDLAVARCAALGPAAQMRYKSEEGVAIR